MTSFEDNSVRVPDQIIRERLIYNDTFDENDIDMAIINESIQSFLDHQLMIKKRENDLQRFMQEEERIKREYEDRMKEQIKNEKIMMDKIMSDRIELFTPLKQKIRYAFDNELSEKIITSINNFCQLKTYKFILDEESFNQLTDYLQSNKHRMIKENVNTIISFMTKDIIFDDSEEDYDEEEDYHYESN